MVNKYTANKRLRSEDAYTPDGRPDMRPEYPSIVYSQILKKLYPDAPVILGGIEASMRRLSHYDYWQDKVQKSILCDSGADLLIYGMGEKPIVELIRKMKNLLPTEQATLTTNEFKTIVGTIPQTAYLCRAAGRQPKKTFNFILTKNAWQTRRSRQATSGILKKNPTNMQLHASHRR